MENSTATATPKATSPLDFDVPWLEVNKNRIQVIEHVLLGHLRDEHSVRITDEGVVYAYDHDEGLHNQTTHQTLSALIKGHIPEELRKVMMTENLRRELTTDMPNVQASDFNSCEDLVAFFDGVLNIRTGKFSPHSAEHLITRKLPCRYNADATLAQAPVFNKFLNDLQQNDPSAIAFILEYIGAICSFVPGHRFKRLFLLVGPGNTGKSQLLNFVTAVLGEENYCAIDLANLTERFGPIGLRGKRLGCFGDARSMDIEDLSILKALTGSDSIRAEHKGKDAISFRFTGYLWINCNKLPFFRGDRGEHMYERFKIVRADSPVPKEQRDPYLLQKFLSEKEIIINVAIRHLAEAVKNGYVFTETEMMECEREEYKIANNSLLTFVSQCCDLNAGRRTRRSEFNQFYQAWCHENNIRAEKPKETGEQMREQFHIQAEKICGHYFYALAILPEVEDELKITTKYHR